MRAGPMARMKLFHAGNPHEVHDDDGHKWIEMGGRAGGREWEVGL